METEIEKFQGEIHRFMGAHLPSVLRDVADWVEQNDIPFWHIVIEFSEGIDENENSWCVFIYRLAKT